MSGTAETITIGKVRKALVKPTRIPLEEQILSFRSETLLDHQTLAQVGIDGQATITLSRPTQMARPSGNISKPEERVPRSQPRQTSITPLPQHQQVLPTHPNQTPPPQPPAGPTASNFFTTAPGGPSGPSGIPGPSSAAVAPPKAVDASSSWYPQPQQTQTRACATTSTSTTGLARLGSQDEDVVRPDPQHDAETAFLVHCFVDNKKYRVPVVGDVGQITIGQIKGYVEGTAKIPSAAQCLAFNGHILQNDQTAAEVGMQDQSVLHLNVLPGHQVTQTRRSPTPSQDAQVSTSSERQPDPRRTPPPSRPNYSTPTYDTNHMRRTPPPQQQQPETPGGVPRRHTPTPATTHTRSTTPPPSNRSSSVQPQQQYDSYDDQFPIPTYCTPEEMENVRKQREIQKEVDRLEQIRAKLQSERAGMRSGHRTPSPIGRFAFYSDLEDLKRETKAQLTAQQRLAEEWRGVEAEKNRIRGEKAKLDSHAYREEANYVDRERELENERLTLLRRQQELLQCPPLKYDEERKQIEREWSRIDEEKRVMQLEEQRYRRLREEEAQMEQERLALERRKRELLTQTPPKSPSPITIDVSPSQSDDYNEHEGWPHHVYQQPDSYQQNSSSHHIFQSLYTSGR
eukprot:TRINITY_DN67314_c5_g17_i1.p1 TRINITY_DN67314_c5_g17~~TRINITY_DN67314_c5_g17_i1.p1  ORF type:complete len:679 (-),score=96.93 TRINITY_DN67314_c5_g17_i1:112-1992(-)